MGLLVIPTLLPSSVTVCTLPWWLSATWSQPLLQGPHTPVDGKASSSMRAPSVSALVLGEQPLLSSLMRERPPASTFLLSSVEGASSGLSQENSQLLKIKQIFFSRPWIPSSKLCQGRAGNSCSLSVGSCHVRASRSHLSRAWGLAPEALARASHCGTQRSAPGSIELPLQPHLPPTPSPSASRPTAVHAAPGHTSQDLQLLW